MYLVTPENLAEILVGIGAILSALGGFTLWKARKDPPEAGSVDSFKLALVENTLSIKKLTDIFKSMEDQFEENNKLFNGVLVLADSLLQESRESRRELNLMREHLSAIRDANNRKNP
jgi:hypothetical protein